MCNNTKNRLLIFSKSLILFFSLIQLGLISVIILISKGFEEQKLYNMEDLGFKQYRTQTEFTGTIFISLALFSSILGLALISHQEICCQKPLLFVYGLLMTFVFFSFLIFGSGLVLVSKSSSLYFDEYCSIGRVTTQYQDMITQLVQNVDDAY